MFRDCALLLLSLLLAAPVAAQSAPAPTDSGAFVVTLGADTIAVERYVRTATRFDGEMLLRTPATTHRRWTAELAPDERVTRFTFESRRVAGDAPPTHAELAFGAESVTVRLRTGDRDTTLHVAAAGAMPYVNYSYGIMELALRTARHRPGADGVVLPMVPVGARAAEPAVIRRVGRDSATLAVFEPHPYRMRVDGDDRILGLRGDATTQKVVVRRVPTVDIAATRAGWARRDAAGAALGTLSPLDSARGTVGAAEVSVVYSRPSLRGRPLLGFLIPYDAPWRTGANAATVLRTSRDLDVGGTRLPAGSYSLWTVVTRDGAQLVVNRQTGQWGTEHDPSQDLARIPLAMTTGHPVRERFTFVVEDGRLVYAWGEVEFAVAVREAR